MDGRHVAGRREEVLGAAIDVLSTAGSRGLTYQAVDERAGAPAGTTSNHFRNRAALLAGVVSHLVALDRRDWDSFAGPLRPTSLEDVVEALSNFAGYATGPGRARSTARYALFLEAVSRPELAVPLARGRAALVEIGSPWLAELGSMAPEEHCRQLTDYLDGVILHQLAFPSPDFAPELGIHSVLVGLLTPVTQ